MTAFLRRAGRQGLLLGFDLKKDPSRLHAAYNDAAGWSEEFSKNILLRIGREFGCETLLPKENFYHYSAYNPRRERIEVNLVARAAFRVNFYWTHPTPEGGEVTELVQWKFEEGEPIFVEPSYKYTFGTMARHAHAANLAVYGAWTDEQRYSRA